MIPRRTFMAGTAALALSEMASAKSRAFRAIPQRATTRVIVDNDFAGDPDGLFALAHQLLSPKTRTVLVTSSLLDPTLMPDDLKQRGAATQGAVVARELIKRLGAGDPPPVVAGHDSLGASGLSAAAQAIVDEARRDDPVPLILCCGGPLTNVAAALRHAPNIAKHMTLIWIGGGAYPDGGWEYNLATDVEAARHVIESSMIPLTQVPLPAYRQMQYSIAEMTADLRPISPFTEWLYDQFTQPPSFVTLGGTWPMGDSPPVLFTAISEESSRFEPSPARRIKDDLSYGETLPNVEIRLCTHIDVRLTFADFLAKLRLHAQRA